MAHDMHSTARPRSHTGAECTRAVCAGVAGTAASGVRVVTICSACAPESASERTSRISSSVPASGEPQKLLLHAGYAQLYVRDPRDSILFYALDNGMSLVACNQQLDERGEAILG